MTLLGPLLMASIVITPVLIAKYSQDQDYKILLIDQNPRLFKTVLPGSKNITFVNDTISLEKAKAEFDPESYYGILYLPSDIIKNPGGAALFTQKQANLEVTGYIESALKKEIEDSKLKAEGIRQDILQSIETRVNLKTLTLQGQESNAGLTTAVGFAGGILIYIFIFLYGVQVMRGVIEEKTNRIVEVVISSVRPFQLMMGKIIGIALVGITQFLLWIILTSGISAVAGSAIMKDRTDTVKIAQEMGGQRSGALSEISGTKNNTQDASQEIFKNLDSINFPLIISCFLVYFLGGYLLYSALFAAIGAAVDNETETQQFMFPVTIPLILSFIVAQTIIENPDSQMGFWFSMIPFTSPVVMMVRIAFGVPAWELALSFALLIAGFIATTWIAARIYRTGILLYGKKITYRELTRWLFYKQ